MYKRQDFSRAGVEGNIQGISRQPASAEDGNEGVSDAPVSYTHLGQDLGNILHAVHLAFRAGVNRSVDQLEQSALKLP